MPSILVNSCHVSRATRNEDKPDSPTVKQNDRSGRLTSELDTCEDYKRYKPDHTKYTGEIVREIQKKTSLL